MFESTVILARINERSRTPRVASDYWDFLQNDPQEGNALKPHERILTYTQVSSSFIISTV